MGRHVEHVADHAQPIEGAHQLACRRLFRICREPGGRHQCYRYNHERHMRELHCAVHCHVKPMPRSLFSAYVESGLAASSLLPSGFGDRQARKEAVARAAARPARRRALENLGKPGTAVVITGQQVGLFLGPLYTIYKAATAIVLAETLAVETGTPVVPIFWMATEDHDFAEID